MSVITALRAGLVSTVVVAVSSVAVAAGPQLVTNGSFEATSTIAGSGWTPSGFIAEGFDFLIDTNPADAQSGIHSFAGGAIGAPGFISQNLMTIPAQLYDIRLWLANFSGFAGDTEIQVRWGGQLVYDATDSLGSGYREIVIDRAATTATTTLAIGLRDDAFFLKVDTISVRSVPEPTTLALLLGAFCAASLSRRRRFGA